MGADLDSSKLLISLVTALKLVDLKEKEAFKGAFSFIFFMLGWFSYFSMALRITSSFSFSLQRKYSLLSGSSSYPYQVSCRIQEGVIGPSCFWSELPPISSSSMLVKAAIIAPVSFLNCFAITFLSYPDFITLVLILVGLVRFHTD